jgi:preprotein translocase subunit SecE
MKEGEVADSKRGGRSNDDEFDNEELDEFDDDELDDALDGDESDDDFGDEDGEDEDEQALVSAGARSRTAAKTARSAKATKVARPKKKTKDDVGPGIIGRFIRFVREVVAELQKVIWPTRKELLTYTTVVVVFVAIVMTIVALLDLGFAKTMFAVFGGKTITSNGQ